MDEKEIGALMQQLGLGLKPSEVALCFREMDIGRSGAIDVSEFERCQFPISKSKLEI